MNAQSERILLQRLRWVEESLGTIIDAVREGTLTDRILLLGEISLVRIQVAQAELHAMGRIQSGRCRFCGCTPECACIGKDGGACSWANEEKTLCSNLECVAAYAKAQAPSSPGRHRTIARTEARRIPPAKKGNG